MKILMMSLQVVVALGLLNVWLFRFGRSSAYRGGNAKTMREEFAVYGLPGWFMVLIGVLKVGAAICLLAGLWLHILVMPAALLICVLMVGALAMHLKAEDNAQKYLPALAVLILSAVISWGAYTAI
jgi:uncharacterized membrane protein YphA (DoxX/SURF4 family)